MGHPPKKFKEGDRVIITKRFAVPAWDEIKPGAKGYIAIIDDRDSSPSYGVKFTYCPDPGPADSGDPNSYRRNVKRLLEAPDWTLFVFEHKMELDLDEQPSDDEEYDEPSFPWDVDADPTSD